MKYVYIIGLEHSGTTLTDHLLSQHPNVLGLGEVTSFFSEKRMQQYMLQYGSFPDIDICSCQAKWSECSFWGGLIELCGLNSDIPLVEKYITLFDYVRLKHGEDTIIVDSSKSINTLNMLINNCKRMRISIDDIVVIFSIKDVRSFAASIIRKNKNLAAQPTIFSVLKTFNWWRGENRRCLEFLREKSVYFYINLYENLCFSPQNLVNTISEKCGVEPVNKLDISHNRSHIAMGNKDFVMCNREQIRYDTRWFFDDSIAYAYLFHQKARQFNKEIHVLSSIGIKGTA